MRSIMGAGPPGCQTLSTKAISIYYQYPRTDSRFLINTFLLDYKSYTVCVICVLYFADAYQV